MGIPLLNALILRSFAPLLGLLVIPIGYGINEEKGQKSSLIGTFFLKFFNFFWANVLTRLTVGILYGLSTILYYRDIRVLYACGITSVITVLFGAFIKNEPTIKLWKIQLNLEEILIGMGYGTAWILGG